MYEDQTFENILERMLDRVPDYLDKREGSVIYNALAPAAWEFAELYIQIDINNRLVDAETSTGERLTQIASGFGVNRYPATAAQRKGFFYGPNDVLIDIPIGSRYSLNDTTYTATSRIGLGEYVLTAETLGSIGNQDFGNLLPVDYVDGLVLGVLGGILVPGDDEELDEELRTRFFEEVNEQAFGGNVADYRQMIKELDGVSSVKIQPVWQGGGTVKATIMASGYAPPSSTLIAQIQEIVDPVPFAGQGIGLAPIGHTVTIVGVNWMAINISTTLTLTAETTIGQVQQDIEDVINSYFMVLRQTWENEAPLTIRVAQIESRILSVSGVVDVMNTLLNGSANNLSLTIDQVPQLGTVTLDE